MEHQESEPEGPKKTGETASPGPSQFAVVKLIIEAKRPEKRENLGQRGGRKDPRERLEQ